jgi:peptidoglycan/LPS O-acetylase OafA/YrhL
MRIFYKIVIGLIIVLGSLHSLLTFVFYDKFSPGALWFFGAGLALQMLGFLNVANLRHGKTDALVRILCAVSNAIFAALFVAANFIIPEPQVFVGIFSCAAAAVLSLRADAN